jgi:hypothetical protein
MRSSSPARVLLTATLIAACGGPGEDAATVDDPDEVEESAGPPHAPAAGFIALAGVDYELGTGNDALALRSTDTRLFWAYQPADDEPEDAPLLVLFNGGPGVSSGMLLGLSTGRASFDPKLTGPDATVVDNPHSWTSLGNLLWIDARQTGFSHGLLDDAADMDARAEAMSIANFNAYRDAADVVRALLSFLAEHGELQDNEVVLVGESYGGTRAQIMLDMLLHPGSYEDGTRRLRDATLVSAIRAHHEQVHGVAEDPAIVAAQFGRQVLIQPLLAGQLQKSASGELYEAPGSVVEQLADELGVDYVRCGEQARGECDPFRNAMDFLAEQGRSSQDYRAPSTWAHELFTLVRYRLNDVATTEALLGVDAATIIGLAADERDGAWRTVDPDTDMSDATLGDWPEYGGALEPWDRYFIVFNTAAKANYYGDVAESLDLEPLDPHYGELFLSNLVWVETLVTNAAYDLATSARGIPPALASYDAIVSDVTAAWNAELWAIEYRDEAFGGPGTRYVTVPRYDASHVVTLDASAELRDDIATWMAP